MTDEQLDKVANTKAKELAQNFKSQLTNLPQYESATLLELIELCLSMGFITGYGFARKEHIIEDVSEAISKS